MKSNRIPAAQARRIVAQWDETGRVLARLRLDELASQSAEASRQAAWDMLDLGGRLPEPPQRTTTSGLVEMQRLFAALRQRARV